MPRIAILPAPIGPVSAAATDKIEVLSLAHPPIVPTATFNAPMPTLAAVAAVAMIAIAPAVFLIGAGKPEITPTVALAICINGLNPAAATLPTPVPMESIVP